MDRQACAFFHSPSQIMGDKGEKYEKTEEFLAASSPIWFIYSLDTAQSAVYFQPRHCELRKPGVSDTESSYTYSIN